MLQSECLRKVMTIVTCCILCTECSEGREVNLLQNLDADRSPFVKVAASPVLRLTGGYSLDGRGSLSKDKFIKGDTEFLNTSIGTWNPVSNQNRHYLGYIVDLRRIIRVLFYLNVLLCSNTILLKII